MRMTRSLRSKSVAWDGKILRFSYVSGILELKNEFRFMLYFCRLDDCVHHRCFASVRGRNWGCNMGGVYLHKKVNTECHI